LRKFLKFLNSGDRVPLRRIAVVGAGLQLFDAMLQLNAVTLQQTALQIGTEHIKHIFKN